jgi:hypothetical protein
MPNARARPPASALTRGTRRGARSAAAERYASARLAPASRPAFRLASTNSSMSPSSTALVLPTLDAGAQVLDADWSRT